MRPERVLFLADGVADGAGLDEAPGAVLVEIDQREATVGGMVRLLGAGAASVIEGLPGAAGARRRRLEGCVLLPGLVNAHTHLDLTHIGPRSFPAAGGFSAWAEMIRAERHATRADILASVQDGARRSLAGGVVAVGDIAGAMRIEPSEALRSSGMLGVSFLEFFGIGAGQRASGDRLEALLADRADLMAPGRVRLGLQPHAPYSVGFDLYERTVDIARRRSLPLATHLAETAAERRLIERGDGPLQDMLHRLGVWDDAAGANFGRGASPVGYLQPILAAMPFLLAHVNDCTDDDLRILGKSGASVAYCPRASAYFANDRDFGPHRYRDMLKAGVTVALGTDSIVNLPSAEASRLSTLDEMRFLWSRDATDAATLLAMGTINGARALGLDEAMFQFGRPGARPGAGRPLAGLIAVELAGVGGGRRGGGAGGSPVSESVMRSRGGVELLAGPGGVS